MFLAFFYSRGGGTLVNVFLKAFSAKFASAPNGITAVGATPVYHILP